MSSAIPDPPLVPGPTPDDLAGIPVSQEEDQRAARIRGLKPASGRPRGVLRVRGKPRAKRTAGLPTADDLAGIPVTADGREDLTVRPRKRCPPQ
jgi:hypothetical protein